MNQINTKIVLVSPLLRTILTAIHLFKNHPQKGEIKFVLVPLLKESLDSTYSTNKRLDKLKETIEPLIKEHGLNFDYSMMSMFGIQDLYQVAFLCDIECTNKIYS